MVIAANPNEDSLTRFESTPDGNKSCEEIEILSPKVVFVTNEDYIKQKDEGFSM
jgi:hypothetical protein